VRTAIRAGLQLLPEDRKAQGLVLQRSVLENITLGDLRSVASHGILRNSQARARAAGLIERLGIRAASADVPVGALSGGNQQKVLLARCLFTAPQVLIVDEPTRGIDVGAKRVIYDVLVSLVDEGLGVLMISSELEEVLGLSHRVAVMRRGEIVAELSGSEVTEERVMSAAFGGQISGGEE
jgi:ABC-type sugar transport system ATPase subunit